jgi:hypothetical protein
VPRARRDAKYSSIADALRRVVRSAEVFRQERPGLLPTVPVLERLSVVSPNDADAGIFRILDKEPEEGPEQRVERHALG